MGIETDEKTKFEIINKHKNFVEFLNDNSDKLGDELSRLFKNFCKYTTEYFMYYFALYVYPYHLTDGTAGLIQLIEGTTKHYEKKSFEEACPDKQVRDKLVRYLEFFSFAIDTNNEAYAKKQQQEQQEQ